ncbi:histidine--tRNA ligase [Candidatus Saccharibacteria bacterium CPR2]|nr:histidine--tRNA ligase [Candidatus Saccharibacteria bacterium CPR2]
MNKLPVQPYKGARDFYPEDKLLQNYIFSVWRGVAERYGYEEYDAPILELTDLYRAKSGEEIVNEQTYSFTDRGGRDVSLRPEMTPTVSRMVAARRQELSYPLRWYSIPNVWRYERPQRGRLREHWQLNVDVFGVKTIDAELELIQIAKDIMHEFGASDDMYQIQISSRKLVNLLMAQHLKLDVMQSHLMIKLLDKADKIPRETLLQEASQIFDDVERNRGMKNLEDILNAKTLADLPPSIVGSDSVKEIQILFTLLKEHKINNAVFNATLMRGFDYYTDIVFEVRDKHPDNNRSMFGGGRYDGLVGLFGVEPLPVAGFGMGDVTIADFLATHQLTPKLQPATDVYVVIVGDVLKEAQKIARELREEGVNVAVDLSGSKTDKQLKSAVKKNIPFALFIGSDELANEQFTLKELASQKEQKLSLERVISYIKDNRRE